jgi:hypothetical protein
MNRPFACLMHAAKGPTPVNARIQIINDLPPTLHQVSKGTWPPATAGPAYALTDN